MLRTSKDTATLPTQDAAIHLYLYLNIPILHLHIFRAHSSLWKIAKVHLSVRSIPWQNRPNSAAHQALHLWVNWALFCSETSVNEGWWSYCMKPESSTACWVIVTLGLGCSAGHCRFQWKSSGLTPKPPYIRAPQVVRCKNCLTFHKDDGYCEGRTINKLQNSLILLVFQILKIRNIRFVGNLTVSSKATQ